VNLFVLLGVLVVLVALRWAKLNPLMWLVATWVSIYVIFSYAIVPPLPVSIVVMFMFIVTLATLTFMSADSERMRSVSQSLIKFMVDKAYRVPLIIALLGLPSLVAWKVYSDATSQPEAPISARTIHPVPPTSIQFQGKTIDLLTVHNPFRELETSDPDVFAEHVANGRAMYYTNCVYCHGDNMEGNGIFAHGFDPIPANFQDPTTIAMLQEGYLFWRIAKGGPGLPNESTPWASAMPAWETFMSEADVWDVIIFLYDYTGYRPRATEEEH